MPSVLLLHLTKLEKRKNKHVVLCYRRKISDVRNKSIFSSFPLSHILGKRSFVYIPADSRVDLLQVDLLASGGQRALFGREAAGGERRPAPYEIRRRTFWKV